MRLTDEIVVPCDLRIQKGESFVHVAHHRAGKPGELFILIIDNYRQLLSHCQRCLGNDHTVFGEKARYLIDLRDTVPHHNRLRIRCMDRMSCCLTLLTAT